MNQYGMTDVPAAIKGKDVFSVKSYINGLEEFILNCPTPMSIALQGDWGTGKTTFLKTIQEDFKEKSDKIKTIYFNTWAYSQFNNCDGLYFSLISNIINQLDIKDEKIKKYANDLLTKISTLVMFGVKSFLEKKIFDFTGAEPKKVEAILSGEVQELEEHAKAIQSLKEIFAALVKEIVDSINKNNVGNKARIVICIDDLDRLEPKRAIEVLEVLKLFMDVENCVYLLAIDYNVVVKGIKNKYNGEIDDEKGDYFFEKLIQVPFTVPVHNYDIENYIEKLLDNLIIVGKDNQNNDNQNTDSFSSSVLPIILKSVGKHPRNIKRLLNSFSLLLRIQDSNKKVSRERLLAVLCLQTSYKEVFFFLSESDAENITERFNSLKETSESFAEGEIDKPEGFDDFMNEFQKIFEDDNILNSEALKLSLNISEAVSSGKKEEDSDSKYIDFWSGFSQYLKNRDNFEFRHSGNKVSSKYYRVISTESSKLHCEFRVNKNSIGLVYGDVKDEKLNEYLRHKEDEIKSKFIDDIVSIRDWKNDPKNNYNRIPGVTITNNRLGIGGYSNYELIYEWFYTTLMTVVKYINELKEKQQ